MARPCPLLKTMVSAVVVMNNPMVGLSWHKSFTPLFSVCNLPRHATLLHIDVQLKLTVKTICTAQCLPMALETLEKNVENFKVLKICIEKSTYFGATNSPLIA